MATVVKAFSISPFLLEHAMIPDFLGDSGAVLINPGSDRLETEPLVEAVLNFISEVKGEMFVLVHGTSFPAGFRYESVISIRFGTSNFHSGIRN